MDYLEKELEGIEQFNKKAVRDYKSLLAKTFYKTAGDVNKSSKQLDKEFSRIFPETMNMGILVENFNPHCVVEFKDNKATKVIDEWDRDFGLLPNRKVMGSYFIDVGTTDVSKAIGAKYNTTHNHNTWIEVYDISSDTFSDILHHPHNTRFDIAYNQSCKLTNGKNILGQGVNPNLLNIQKVMQYKTCELGSKHIKKYVDRGEMDSMIFGDKVYEFEVDNYLNLYHKPSGLYLMFNKIPFPGLPFYLNKHITQFKGKTYYPIYKSKKLEKFDFEFNKTLYDSIDSRNDFLEKINHLIPYDYDVVYDFYNRFRKMMKLNSPDKSKTGKSEKSDVVESTEVYDDLYDDFEDVEETDNVDSVSQNIILEYQNRLRTTVVRAEEAEKAVSDMYTDFNKKTAEVVELNKVILDLKKELSDDRDKAENQQQMKYVEQIGQLENEIMLLKKKLVESNVFKVECESNGISIDKLKKENVKKEQEAIKLRSLNDGLMKQVQTEKSRSDKLSEDMQNLMAELREKDDNIREYVRRVEGLDGLLKKTQVENGRISNKLKEMGNSSDNYLEKALSDKIENLESSKNDLVSKNHELMRDNRRLNAELSKIKNMMAGFIN